MSRRRRAEKRPIPEDPRYGSSLVTVLVNMVMSHGKSLLLDALCMALSNVPAKS